MRVRPERLADHDAVREVVRAAFGEDGVASLLDDLRTNPAWLALSWVAEDHGEVVGHVSLSRAWVDDPHALVAAALTAAADRDEPLVFLEGDPRYYSRLGFVAAGPLGFTAPSTRIPEPAFQVWPAPAYHDGLSGALVYPDVFWRHDAVGLRP